MIKKLMPVCFLFALVVALSAPAFTQESKPEETKDKAAKADKADKKEARFEGTVVRTSADNSTLEVRKAGGGMSKIIHYDSSTRWVSQKHGSKEVNDIDASQVKDGDRVIVRGTEDKKGGFHATLISKRLTPLAGNR